MLTHEYLENTKYQRFNVICRVAGFVLFLLTIEFGRAGIWPIVVLLCLANSPFIMIGLGYFMERDNLLDIINPRYGSWAFLFGDAIFLPLLAGSASSAWNQGDHLNFGNAVWLPVVAIGAGFAVTYVFEKVLDGPNYTDKGEAGRLISPTKLWHDKATFFSLSAILIALAFPVLATLNQWTHHTVHPVLIVIALAGFIGMVVADMFRDVEIPNLHPAMSMDINWQPVALRGADTPAEWQS